MKILTDDEHRIFFAAMAREREICKKTDKEFNGKINLINICNSVIEKVNNAEPVRYGHWIVIDQTGMDGRDGWYCSECRKKIYGYRSQIKKRLKKYCPNCGAKMEATNGKTERLQSIW